MAKDNPTLLSSDSQPNVIRGIMIKSKFALFIVLIVNMNRWLKHH